MNDALTLAIREAYACAPSNVITLETLEIYNPTVGGKIYIVADVRNHELTLETGEVVVFKACPFRIALPKINDSGTQELSIAIDNIDRQISDFVKLSKASPYPTEVLYRPYISDDPTTPQMNPPMQLYILDSVVTTYEVRSRATFINYLNKKFPSQDQYYVTSRFPSLGR